MFDYNEALNSLDLSTVCRAVVLDTEEPAVYPGGGYEIPGRPGVELDPETDVNPLLLVVRVYPRYTNSSGVITHTDGEEGHWEENLSTVKAELRKRTVTLLRSFPHKGRLRAVGRVTDSLLVSTGLQFHLLVPSGSWQDNTEDSETGNPPTATTGGDTEIHDPRLTISAAGETEVTLSDGTVYTITAAAGPTYPIVVDVGAGTVLDNGGADAAGDVAFSHEHWLRLDAASAVSITTDNQVTLHWRNRWS